MANIKISDLQSILNLRDNSVIYIVDPSASDSNASRKTTFLNLKNEIANDIHQDSLIQFQLNGNILTFTKRDNTTIQIDLSSLAGDGGTSETSESIKQKLENLIGEDRLDISAIKGADVLDQRISTLESQDLFTEEEAQTLINASIAKNVKNASVLGNIFTINFQDDTTKNITLPEGISQSQISTLIQNAISNDISDASLIGNVLTLNKNDGSEITLTFPSNTLSASQIKDSLETLEGEERLDAGSIKGLPEAQDGGLTSVRRDSTLSGSGIESDPLKVAIPYTQEEKEKLENIEDQTAEEIKTLYESNDDTNVYSDSEKTKLSGLENNSKDDQSAVEIKTLYESNDDTNAFTDSEKTKLDSLSVTGGGLTETEVQTLIDTALNPNVKSVVAKEDGTGFAVTNQDDSITEINFPTNNLTETEVQTLINTAQRSDITSASLVGDSLVFVKNDGTTINLTLPTTSANNVQTDWEETDTQDPAYLKNKPTINSDGSATPINFNSDLADVTKDLTLISNQRDILDILFSSRNLGRDFNFDSIGVTDFTSDGTTLWILSGNLANRFIYAYNLETKQRDSSKDFLNGFLESRLLFGIVAINVTSDILYISVSHRDINAIVPININTRSIISHSNLSTSIFNLVRDIYRFKNIMYVIGSERDNAFSVYAYNIVTRQRETEKEIDIESMFPNYTPLSITSDGTTLWILIFNSLEDDRKIVAYNLETKQRDQNKDLNNSDNIFKIWADENFLYALFSSNSSFLPRRIYAYNIRTTTLPDVQKTLNKEKTKEWLAVADQQDILNLQNKTSGLTLIRKPNIDLPEDEDVKIALASLDNVLDSDFIDEIFTNGIARVNSGNQEGILVVSLSNNLNLSDYILEFQDTGDGDSIIENKTLHLSDFHKQVQVGSDSKNKIFIHGGFSDTSPITTISTLVKIVIRKKQNERESDYTLASKPVTQINTLIDLKIGEIPASSSSGASLTSSQETSINKASLLKFQYRQEVHNIEDAKWFTQGEPVATSKESAISFSPTINGKSTILIPSLEVGSHPNFTIRNSKNDLIRAGAFMSNPLFFFYNFDSLESETYTIKFTNEILSLKVTEDLKSVENRLDIIETKPEITSEVKDFHSKLTENTITESKDLTSNKVDISKSAATLALDGEAFQINNLYAKRGSTVIISGIPINPNGYLFSGNPIFIGVSNSEDLLLGMKLRFLNRDSNDQNIMNFFGKILMSLQGNVLNLKKYIPSSVENTMAVLSQQLNIGGSRLSYDFDYNSAENYGQPSENSIFVDTISSQRIAELNGRPTENSTFESTKLILNYQASANGNIVTRGSFEIPLNEAGSYVGEEQFFVVNDENERIEISYLRNSTNNNRVNLRINFSEIRNSVVDYHLIIQPTQTTSYTHAQNLPARIVNLPIGILLENQENDLVFSLSKDVNDLVFNGKLNGISVRVISPLFYQGLSPSNIVTFLPQQNLGIRDITILSANKDVEFSDIPSEATLGLKLVSFFNNVITKFDIGNVELVSKTPYINIPSLLPFNIEENINSTNVDPGGQSFSKIIKFSGDNAIFIEGSELSSDGESITLPKGIWHLDYFFYVLNRTINQASQNNGRLFTVIELSHNNTVDKSFSKSFYIRSSVNFHSNVSVESAQKILNDTQGFVNQSGTLINTDASHKIKLSIAGIAQGVEGNIQISLGGLKAIFRGNI